jgi:hypothetical protein
LTVAQVYAANIQRRSIARFLHCKVTDTDRIEGERVDFAEWCERKHAEMGEPFRHQVAAWRQYVSELYRYANDEPLFTHRRSIERTVARAIRPANYNEYGGQA